MPAATLTSKLRALLEMIKFSHTVFAFPFALMGAVLAALASGKAPTWVQIGWICLAMVGARSAAMGLNRLIDARIDAQNPRTAARHIPAGVISRAEAWLFVAGATALLLVAAWMLNPLCLALSPVALVWSGLYSYTKRFTRLCHFFLGSVLGLAPLAGWLAAQPQVARVHYAGLPSHPQHALAARQQRGFGGVVSFELAGGRDEAWRFIDATRLLSITANLGDVRSTITHPASTTHGRVGEEERARMGVTENLVRVSVGLEDVEDIKADLARGLAAL